MLLSIITVVRNDAPGLTATAASLQAQTDREWEWLVKDGASTDGTSQLLSDLEPKPTWAESSTDGGIYDAMNRAAEHAQGDWLLFLNAGDVLCEDVTLERVSEILRRCDKSWAFGAVRNVNAAGKAIGWQSASPFNSLGLAIGQTTIPHQATFIRRDHFHDLGGFRTDFGTEADQELAYRASLTGAPEEIVWPIADFRLGGVGMSRPVGHFAKAMRRARREQGRPLFGNSFLDFLATGALVIKEHAKSLEANAIRKVGGSS